MALTHNPRVLIRCLRRLEIWKENPGCFSYSAWYWFSHRIREKVNGVTWMTIVNAKKTGVYMVFLSTPPRLGPLRTEKSLLKSFLISYDRYIREDWPSKLCFHNQSFLIFEHATVYRLFGTIKIVTKVDSFIYFRMGISAKKKKRITSRRTSERTRLSFFIVLLCLGMIGVFLLIETFTDKTGNILEPDNKQSNVPAEKYNNREIQLKYSQFALKTKSPVPDNNTAAKQRYNLNNRKLADVPIQSDWQPISNSADKFYVYSAYYMNKPQYGNEFEYKWKIYTPA